jgi:hypothetical protein
MPRVARGLAVLAALGVVAWRVTRRDDAPATAPITAPVGLASDAATQIAEATPDATPEIALAPADAAIAATTPDAGVEPHERPRPNPLPAPRDAGTARIDAATVTAPTTATRKVTINSVPWSNWTVDGGEPHAGLQTIQLTPGTHTIHFTGQPYFKADKTVTITVPDEDGFKFSQILEPAPAP